MESQSCSKRFKITAFVLTAGVILFAFIHSSMPSDISGGESESILKFLQDIFNFFGLKSVELSDLVVRKAAHFIEYTALGCMMMTCAYSFNRYKPYIYSFQMFFVGLATAVCDETIQLSVSGRSGQITDVLLDFSGVITGLITMLAVYTLYRKIKKS